MSFNDEQVRKFEAALERALAQREQYHTTVFRESVRTAFGALTGPTAYGPGVPRDTGLTSDTFGVAIGSPEQGTIGSTAIDRVRLEDRVFITNPLAHVIPLEEARTRTGGPMRRRTAQEQLKDLRGTGGPTTFAAPVIERWPQIVDDVVERMSPP